MLNRIIVSAPLPTALDPQWKAEVYCGNRKIPIITAWSTVGPAEAFQRALKKYEEWEAAANIGKR